MQLQETGFSNSTVKRLLSLCEKKAQREDGGGEAGAGCLAALRDQRGGKLFQRAAVVADEAGSRTLEDRRQKVLQKARSAHVPGPIR